MASPASPLSSIETSTPARLPATVRFSRNSMAHSPGDLQTQVLEGVVEGTVVVLAAALVCLGMLCRSESALPSGLGLAAYAEALLLLGIALAGVLRTDTAYDVYEHSGSTISRVRVPVGTPRSASVSMSIDY